MASTLTIPSQLPRNLPYHASRIATAIPLAIHTFCRLLSTQEPTPRSHTISTSKLTAEGAIEEVKVILGWKYDTCRLIISLPDQKYSAWSHDLETIMHKGTTSHSELDTIIDRLNHVAYVIPTARHFLSRIRYFKSSLQFRRLASIPRLVQQDIKLWLGFLHQSNLAISMNLLTYRSPTHVYRSDACEYGISIFSTAGKAWRCKIPDKRLSCAHINLLEFLGSIVYI